MKLFWNNLKSNLLRQDSESEFQYSVFRFLTYSVAILLLPSKEYYRLIYKFNSSYECGNYIDLSFKLNYESIVSIYPVLILFMVFSATGFLFQISSLVSFLLFSMLTYQTLQGCYANHAYFPMGLVLLLWVFNSQTSRHSLDFLLLRFFGFNKDQKKYCFKSSIFSYAKIHFALVFFFAVSTKLRYSGIDWFLSDNLSNRFAMQNFFQNQPTKIFPVLKDINHFFSSHIIYSQLAGFVVVVIEMSMVGLIFVKNKKIQFLLVLLMALLQIGFYMIMYVNFYPWSILYLCWIVSLLGKPIEKIEQRMSSIISRIRQPIQV